MAKKKTAKKKTSNKKTTLKKKTTSKKISSKKTSKSKKFEPDWKYLKPWAKQLDVTVESLKKRVIEKMNIFKKKHPTWTDERIHGKSRLRIFLELKNSLSSTGTDMYSRKVYSGAPFDFGERHYDRNYQAYKQSPKDAKRENLVKIEMKNGIRTIVPLDEREYFNSGFKNRNWKKPLPKHNWIQSVGFISIPVKALEQGNMDELKASTLTLTGAYADPTNIDRVNEKTGKEIEGMFIGDSFNEKGWYQCKFKIKHKKVEEGEEPEEELIYDLSATRSKPELTDIEDASYDTIIQCYDSINISLLDLDDYHDAMVLDQITNAEEEGTEIYKTTNNEIMMVSGQVSSIQLSDGTNSHIVKIDSDEDLSFGEEEGKITPSTMIWFDKGLDINFGLYSEILIFGSTTRNRKKDFISQEWTDEWLHTSITGKGYIVTELVQPEDDENDFEEQDYESDGAVETDEEETKKEEPEKEENEEEEKENKEETKPEEWNLS